MNVRWDGDSGSLTSVGTNIPGYVNGHIRLLGHVIDYCRVNGQVAVVGERSNEVIIGTFGGSRLRHTIRVDRRIDGRIGVYHCRRRHIIPEEGARHWEAG